jgi:hypothetical protein
VGKAGGVNISGIWKSEFDSQIGHQLYTFTFKQDGSNLTGKANSEAGERKREAELKEGKVDGDTVSFVEILSIPDREIRIAYTGKLSADGNEIKFTRAVGDFAKTEIVARREAAGTGAANSQTVRIKAGTETFEGITGPGQRVFSFNVQGHEFKDFDVWVKAGGPMKAYIETVPVEVTDGKLKVTFTPKVENPQICAIEIIPPGGGETSTGSSAQ